MRNEKLMPENNSQVFRGLIRSFLLLSYAYDVEQKSSVVAMYLLRCGGNRGCGVRVDFTGKKSAPEI
jgi:hypothetical protein